MHIAVPDVFFFFFTFCNRVKLVDYTHSLKLHTDIHASVHAAESFSRTTVELFSTHTSVHFVAANCVPAVPPAFFFFYFLSFAFCNRLQFIVI